MQCCNAHREKGGAYGSGAIHQGGVLSFMSYRYPLAKLHLAFVLAMGPLVMLYTHRDPNSMATLETFHRAAEWAVGGEFSDQDVSEALLSVFAKVRKILKSGYLH